MNKIVIVKSLTRQYAEIQKKVIKHKSLIDSVKLLGVFSMVIFVLGMYLYYVNAASTKGYFLRQEMKNLEKERFDSNIISLEVINMEKNLWDVVTDKNSNRHKSNDTINPDEKMVIIPLSEEFTYEDTTSATQN